MARLISKNRIPHPTAVHTSYADTLRDITLTDTHNKKYSIVEAAKVLIMEGIKERFPTYDAAIAEIDRLQSIVNRLEKDYRIATYKPPRGRPRSQSKKKEIAQILHAFPSLPAWIRSRVPLAKGGRPRQKTLQEMIDFLIEFDDEKKDYAKEKGKKSVTDKEFIEFGISTDQGMKVWPEYRRKKEIVERRKTLKYHRDATGIRQKRKTPLN